MLPLLMSFLNLIRTARARNTLSPLATFKYGTGYAVNISGYVQLNATGVYTLQYMTSNAAGTYIAKVNNQTLNISYNYSPFQVTSTGVSHLPGLMNVE